VHEDMLLVGTFGHAAQPVQGIGRFTPERYQPLLPPLAAQAYLPRWRELEIGPQDARDLAHPGAAVVEEEQQRVVTPSVSGAPVRPGKDGPHDVGFEVGRGPL